MSGELAGIRTQDPRLKRALLYLLSYELVLLKKPADAGDEKPQWVKRMKTYPLPTIRSISLPQSHLQPNPARRVQPGGRAGTGCYFEILGNRAARTPSKLKRNQFLQPVPKVYPHETCIVASMCPSVTSLIPECLLTAPHDLRPFNQRNTMLIR
jgi:hypothetical protein